MTQALANRDGRLMAVKQTLTAKKEAIVGMIGDDRQAQRLMASALLIVADEPKILACDPGTIVRSVLQAATLGLDLASALGEAYLVPRGGVCCLDVGYRGWQRKVHEAGFSLIASPVFSSEPFEYVRAPLKLYHKPALSEAGRGEYIGSYAAAYIAGVLSHAEWATPEDVEKARKMSRSPAWPSWPDRMRRKLAIKRLGKELAGAGHEIIRRLVEVTAAEDEDVAVAGIDDPMDRLLAQPDPSTAIPTPGVSHFGGKRPNGEVSREAPGEAAQATQTEPPVEDVAPAPADTAPAQNGAPDPHQEPVEEEEPPPPTQADLEAAGQQKLTGGRF
jgi:phage RecT family recombinase